MKSIRKILSLSSLSLVGALSAQTALFDFQATISGTTDANTDPLAGDVYNIAELGNGAASYSLADAVDTTGAATGWGFSLDLLSPRSTLRNLGGGNTTVFSEAAEEDGIRSAEASGVASVWTYSFSGLTAGASYDITVFANSNLFFTSDVEYLLTAGTADVSSYSGIDTTTAASIVFTEVVADGSGAITFTSTTSGSGNALSRGNTLNALAIEAAVIPEPGTVALFAGLLGAGFIVIRRRRG